MFCVACRFPGTTGLSGGHLWGMAVRNIQTVRSHSVTILLPLDRCLHRIIGICLNYPVFPPDTGCAHRKLPVEI